MLATMQPFNVFMNVENTRSYIDDLYSLDADKCLSSIKCIKNSVIGSNRQKESVIAQGIVPRLLQLLANKDLKLDLRMEAAITIGSLAKGTTEHIEVLINSGTIQLFLDVLEEEDPVLTDACLCCLRTLYQLEGAAAQIKYDMKLLKKMLIYAGPEQRLQRQSCVMTILSCMCRTAHEQNEMCAIGAPQALATLLSLGNSTVRTPALACLASMCYNNPDVANVILHTNINDMRMVDFLSNLISRDKPIEMQLEAARCLTNFARADAIDLNDPMITYRTLPCLTRLCQPVISEQHRATAASILAYLTELDTGLQGIAAISNQLVSALLQLSNCPSSAAKEGAFRAFASLGSNDEDIRKRIIDTKCLMDNILEALDDECVPVKLAAIRCLLSLSRSVQLLRTTFQDHVVWLPLMNIMSGNASVEMLTASSSTICNLILEFSPAKEPLIAQGIIHTLATLTSRPETAIRLNATWALMNMTFQAEQRVKTQILNALGIDQIFRLLADADTNILLKILGLMRNLVSPKDHADLYMGLHGAQVMQGVVLILEGPHPPEVKEQALCILANIADGEKAREHIMSNEDVLKKVIDYMTHPACNVQEAAVYCITNLSRPEESAINDTVERQNVLRDMGALAKLQNLLQNSNGGLYVRVKTALVHFTEV